MGNSRQILSVFLIGISMLLIAQTLACIDPPCPGECWTGENCDEWNCSSGQTCCNGECCDSDKCCTDSGCVAIDRTWEISSCSTLYHIPDGLETAFSNILNSIPGISGVTINNGGMVLATSSKTRECCSSSIKNETCEEGSINLYANVSGTIWETSWSGDAIFFGFGVSVSVEAKAEINTQVYASGTAGYYENECDSSCNYGSLSIVTNISASIGGEIEACVVLFGTGYCADVGIGGFATIGFGGACQINECGSCGTSSNSLSITQATAGLKITWLGNEYFVGNYPIM